MAVKTKEQLLSQKVIAVCNTDFPTPQLVEFSGKNGFDVLFIDCEHSSTDFKLDQRSPEELHREGKQGFPAEDQIVHLPAIDAFAI